MINTKGFWRAALIRAVRSFTQSLRSTLPAGVVVTPIMVQSFDAKGALYTVIAYLLTALLNALMSILDAVLTGLPEVNDGDT